MIHQFGGSISASQVPAGHASPSFDLQEQGCFEVGDESDAVGVGRLGFLQDLGCGAGAELGL